ncbi:Protein trapped in endoderm-1 [Fasciola gigantica]|uniref:Protein trapped in endoderm-1 n=1 Tax=Fasciola gigantica TaxID=46835 RepID=A0A504Y8V1_FASGI|nr:Protein trapped in endoderm-1 [Fasciola gigantica]
MYSKTSCHWLNMVLVLIILHLNFFMHMNVLGEEQNTTLSTTYHRDEFQNSNMTSKSLSQSKPRISVLVTSCVCIAIAIIGVLGNMLVICVLTGSHTRLVYETFCVGLAVTDLTYLTFTTPITVVQYFFRGWIFGLFWCKVFNFVVQVTVFSSAFMLLGLTTSRFLSVVLPWQNLKMTELQAKLFCLGAWIAGVIFASPVLVFQVLMPSREVSLNLNIVRCNGSSPMGIENPMNDTHTCQTHSVVLCRGLFPSQSSRMGYQLLVLLSTYVIPFVGILIMNSTIIYKLQKRNVIERHSRRRQQRPDSTFFVRNNLFRRRCSSKSCNSPNPEINKSAEAGKSNAVPETEIPLEQLSTAEDESRIDQTNLVRKTPSMTAMEIVQIQKAEKKRRTRTKATKLVILVTTLWCVCWLPTHIINSWLNFDEASFPFTPEMVASKLISQMLSFAASCVNPIVYGIMTGTFRAKISTKICRHKRTLNGQGNGAPLRAVTVLEYVT